MLFSSLKIFLTASMRATASPSSSRSCRLNTPANHGIETQQQQAAAATAIRAVLLLISSLVGVSTTPCKPRSTSHPHTVVSWLQHCTHTCILWRNSNTNTNHQRLNRPFNKSQKRSAVTAGAGTALTQCTNYLAKDDTHGDKSNRCTNSSPLSSLRHATVATVCTMRGIQTVLQAVLQPINETDSTKNKKLPSLQRTRGVLNVPRRKIKIHASKYLEPSGGPYQIVWHENSENRKRRYSTRVVLHAILHDARLKAFEVLLSQRWSSRDTD